MEKAVLDEVLTPSINISTDITYLNTSVEDELFITDSIHQLHYNVSGTLQAYYTTMKAENNTIITYNYGNLPFTKNPSESEKNIGGDFCIFIRYCYVGILYDEDKVDCEEFNPKLLFYSKRFNSEEDLNAWQEQKKEELGELSIDFYDLNDQTQSSIYNYN